MAVPAESVLPVAPVSADLLRAAWARVPVGLGLVSLAAREPGRLIEANAALPAALGAPAGALPRTLGQLVPPAARTAVADVLARLAAGEDDEAVVDVPLPGPAGRGGWGRLQAAVLEPGRVAVVHVLDVTDRRQLVTHLRRLSELDELTGLASRRRLLDQAELTLARARRATQSFALLHVELRGTEEIEDPEAPGAADELLRLAARRLVRSLRESDLVARVGTDELAVLVTDLGDASFAEGELAVRDVRSRLTRALLAPFDVDGRPARVSVRTGSALYPRDGQDVDALLAHADAERRRTPPA